MSTPGQIAANRANAQRSTGPKTEEGKARSSHNALKSGLTGRTVLLPTEDVEIYQAHIARFTSKYEPTDEDERELVQRLADTEWRLLRIEVIESGIFAVGRMKLAAEVEKLDDSIRAMVLDGQVYLAYEKQLRNLALQANRLRRLRDKTEEQLDDILEARERLRRAELKEAAAFYVHCQEYDMPFHFDGLRNIGFKISLAEIRGRIAEDQARRECSPFPRIRAHEIAFELRQGEKAA